MLKVKDIMTRSVVYVKPNTPIHKAMEILAKNHFSGIPVVEDDLTLVAIVSEKDIVKFYADIEHLTNKTVYDLMTQPVIFFDENESLFDVCQCFVNNDFRLVPITSHGRLVGIVSRKDIIRRMLKADYSYTQSVVA